MSSRRYEDQSEKTKENENRKDGRTTERKISQQHATDSSQRQEDIASQPNTTTPPPPYSNNRPDEHSQNCYTKYLWYNRADESGDAG